jgi:hypothetical protein
MKAFTAASVSLLVDNADLRSSFNHCPSNLSWQTTLSSIGGDDFALDNNSITSHTTLEDALGNQTGLPDHEFTCSFKPKSASVKDVVHSSRYLPRAAEPGTQYLYSSYMFFNCIICYGDYNLNGSGRFHETKPLAAFEHDPHLLDASRSNGS